MLVNKMIESVFYVRNIVGILRWGMKDVRRDFSLLANWKRDREYSSSFPCLTFRY